MVVNAIRSVLWLREVVSHFAELARALCEPVLTSVPLFSGH
jgi:hypothetical protein